MIRATDVGNLQTAIDGLLKLIVQFGVAVIAILTGLEVWLRTQLRHLGVPPSAQTLILLAVAALLVLGSWRLFGGIIRVAVLLILVLIAIHIALPGTPH
jgi:hypothetical protein